MPVGIETAGSMNLLFTDKTGTLTKGEPEVCGLFWVTARCLSPWRNCSSSKGLYKLYETSAVCNTASIISGGDAAGGKRDGPCDIEERTAPFGADGVTADQ